MDVLKQIFPFSFRAKDTNSLVVSIIIYLVAGLAGAIVIGILGLIPFVGVVFSILGGIVDLYVVVGIVLVLLSYFKVIK